MNLVNSGRLIPLATCCARLALPLVFAMEAAVVQGAEYPKLDVSVDPTSTTIGSPVRMTVRITAPELARLALFEPFRQDDKDAVWLLRSRKELPSTDSASGGKTRTIEYVIATFKTGEVPLPEYSVTWQPPSGDATTATLPRKVVRISSVLPEAAAALDPRDIKPPVVLPYPKWIPVAIVAAILLVLALILKVYWTLFKSRVQKLVRPPKPLDEWAMDELAAIEKDRLIEQKRVREYYTRLTDVIRSYLGRLYAVNALDLTTFELMERLNESGISGTARASTESLLNEADLVKFAKYLPDAAAGRRALETARLIVQETRPRPPAAPEEGTTPAAGAGGGASATPGVATIRLQKTDPSAERERVLHGGDR